MGILKQGCAFVYCCLHIVCFILVSVFSFPAYSQSRLDNYQFLIRQADSLRTVGDFKQAEVTYRQALVLNPNSSKARKGLGKIAFAHQDWSKVNKWFNEALQLNPDDREAKDYLTSKSEVYLLVVKGDSLLNHKRYEEAKDEFKAALELDKNYLAAIRGLGLVAYARGDWKEFKKKMNQVLEINPTDAEAHELLNDNPKMRAILAEADSLSNIENFEKAQKAYNEVLEINKHSIVALKWFGERAYAQQDWGGVKNWYKKVLKLKPADLEANYYLGIAHRETGKNKALFLRKNDFNHSEQYFDMVIQTDSSYQDVLYQRALLERFRENWLAAVIWGQRQVNLKPELAHTNTGLFKLYRLLLIHESDQRIKNWMNDHPSDWSRYALGEYYRRHDDSAKANMQFQKLLARDLNMSVIPIYLSLVRLNLQLGKENEADRYFKMALNSIATDVDAEFMFEDAKFIFTDEELEQFDILESPAEKQRFFEKFWASRNPIPAAATNVRAMEHYRRLVYSEKNFWFDDVKNWNNNPDKLGYLKFPKAYYLNQEFNDKGLIYIRHGAPNDVALTPSAANSNESWFYYRRPDRPELIFHFLIDQNAVGNNWQLVPFLSDRSMLADRAGWDPTMDQLLMASNPLEATSVMNRLADESRKMVFEAMSSDFHTWEKDTRELPMPYYLANFKGSNGKTKLEVYFGLPIPEIQNDKGSNSNLEFEFGTGIYDLEWREIKHNSDEAILASIAPDRIFNNLILYSHDFELKPGTYHLSLYSRLRNSHYIGGWNLEKEIPIFSGNDFSLSDLVIAYDINETSEGSLFKKGGVEVVPNPTKVYQLSEPVFVYYEIYNLKQDKDGETAFEIEDKMTSKKSGGFLGLGGGGKKSISIKDSRTGNQKNVVEYTSFDVNRLDSGDYELSVKVKDLNSGRVVEKTVELVLKSNSN